ncbi:MAG: glycosyltransferase family 4 protein [Pseudomonas sp.]
MKILMLATNYEAPVGGGGQKSLRTLVDALAGLGHEVVVAALAHGEPGCRIVNGVRVHYLPVRNVFRPVDSVQPSLAARLLYHSVDMYNPWSEVDVKRICGEEKPDVVHTHVITGLSVSIWKAVRSLGIPLVHTLRDQYLLCPRSTLFRNGKQCVARCTDCRVLRTLHPRVSNLVGGVIGISKFMLSGHLERGYFSKAEVKAVIYNARDRNALGVGAGTGREHVGEKVRFGYIGSITPSKGVALLLDAFSALQIAGAELWVAGTGNGSYDAHLKKEYASDSIRFLGRVAQKDFFPNVDVVVVPSLWDEPLGMVVAEAFAFGKPVIGSRRGGIVEMIEDGKDGLVFEPEQAGALSAALSRMGSKATIQEMSLNARKSGERFLDIQHYASRHLDVYDAVIAY